MNNLKVPKHLKPETQKWIRGVLGSYELENHHFKLLILAGECWDRVVEARVAIATDGLFTKDRYGTIKQHPAIKIEQDNKIIFCRLIRELGLDIERPNENYRLKRQY